MSATRGTTLVELLMATVLFGLVMTTAYSTWYMLNRVRATQQASVEARQQARILMGELVADIQQSSYLYQTFSGTLDGHSFSTYPVPAAGSSGNSMVMAIAEGDTPPTYTIVACWWQALSPRDPRNPAAGMGVLDIYNGVGVGKDSSGAPLAPSSIDLTKIDSGHNYQGHDKKVFPCYLVPPGTTPPPTPLFTLLPSGSSVVINLVFSRLPNQGPVINEVLTSQVTIRAI